MDTLIKTGWSKPSTILFASDIRANEKAFTVALAQAAEFGADLIFFHAHCPQAATANVNSATRQYDSPGPFWAKRRCLEPWAARARKGWDAPLHQRARHLGLRCETVERTGLADEEILKFLRERNVDRVVMGAHSPGPVGKLLLGSVAETVLRTANVPVFIVGQEVVESTYRHSAAHTVLCSLTTHGSNEVVVRYAAELAANHDAKLVVQQVIPPQDRSEFLNGRTINAIEHELFSMVPVGLRHHLNLRTNVVFGDPAEEVLHESRALPANLIVMGAWGASHFAAVTHACSMYKVLSNAHCPVVTLSPVLMAECGATEATPRTSEIRFMAGVI